MCQAREMRFRYMFDWLINFTSIYDLLIGILYCFYNVVLFGSQRPLLLFGFLISWLWAYMLKCYGRTHSCSYNKTSYYCIIHTWYNRPMTCYLFNWSLNLYAHIFQGYLKQSCLLKIYLSNMSAGYKLLGSIYDLLL